MWEHEFVPPSVIILNVTMKRLVLEGVCFICLEDSKMCLARSMLL